LSAALVARHQRSATRVALDQEFTRTARAFGASRLRIASRGLRASSAAVVSLLGVDLPALITAAFVVEQAFELPGLGPATLAAVGSRDVAWLMAITLASAATVALAQVSSDALLAWIDPRVRVALARKRGAIE
jgi:peptide/nickel transport system permease protein